MAFPGAQISLKLEVFARAYIAPEKWWDWKTSISYFGGRVLNFEGYSTLFFWLVASEGEWSFTWEHWLYAWDSLSHVLQITPMSSFLKKTPRKVPFRRIYKSQARIGFFRVIFRGMPRCFWSCNITFTFTRLQSWVEIILVARLPTSALSHHQGLFRSPGSLTCVPKNPGISTMGVGWIKSSICGVPNHDPICPIPCRHRHKDLALFAPNPPFFDFALFLAKSVPPPRQRRTELRKMPSGHEMSKRRWA